MDEQQRALNHSDNSSVDNDTVSATTMLLFEYSRKINIVSCIALFAFGLVGNVLSMLVFTSRRMRVQSSSVYLLALAASDSLYLLMHLIEDTLRTVHDVYGVNVSFVDQSDAACRATNYLRQATRFVSCWLVVSFTVERYIAVSRPLQRARYCTPNCAIKVVSVLVVVSLAVNLYTPITLSISGGHCDVSNESRRLYLTLTCVYALVTMVIPIAVVCLLNGLILRILFWAKTQRESMTWTRDDKPCLQESTSPGLFHRKSKKAGEKSPNETRKVTIMLLVVSICFAVLNLPYATTWGVYFSTTGLQQSKTSLHWRLELYSIVSIAEIFMVMNFSINFVLYTLSGNYFRSELKTRLSCNRGQQPDHRRDEFRFSVRTTMSTANNLE